MYILSTKAKPTEVCMGKTFKLLSPVVITVAILSFLAGCDNPAMEPNETEYMYSDLSIEKAVWEAAGMNMHIYLEFDEPVRSDRTTGTWTPFTVSFDYTGSNPTVTSPQSPDIDATFTRTRGEEKTMYHFQWMWSSGSASADDFSNVRLSYMAPSNTKIVGLSGAELKNFMNEPATQKGTGGGMGEH
jgi:hypothetical protein